MPVEQQPAGGTALIDRLTQSLAPSATDWKVVETHISWVVLFDQTALKIKKPLQNPFLDYSTIELRRQACEAELRLNRRYAGDLYQSVVAIVEGAETSSNNERVLTLLDLSEPLPESSSEPTSQTIAEASEGPILDYAVRMKRFESDALLASQLEHGKVTPDCIEQLARNIADFHASAHVATTEGSFGSENMIVEDAMDNFQLLQSNEHFEKNSSLIALRSWTKERAKTLAPQFTQRHNAGMIRECHGDLHLENIISWQGQLIPFDGIEFSDRLRWIDVQSDSAFTSMDLLFHGHPMLCHRFVNAYLETTGDYEGLSVLRWYQIYRALVRAKVCLLRAQQEPSQAAKDNDLQKSADFIELANWFTKPASPKLYITHGLSGSGKTHGSQILVDRDGAIRIRSDVERLRLKRGKATNDLYSDDSRSNTYRSLLDLARSIIANGYSVIVDATFLDADHRCDFSNLASTLKVPFHIISFHADRETLVRRLQQRKKLGTDASDADIQVLEDQIASYQPLLDQEMPNVIDGNALRNSQLD